jgi:hypothetical protein
MRIYLLTASVLLTIPTGLYAQAVAAAPSAAGAVTVSAPNETQPETVPIDQVTTAPMQEGQPYQIPDQPGQNFFSAENYQILPGRYVQEPGATGESVGPLIAFTQQDTKTLDELAEDLNIFGFIVKRNLEKAVGEETPQVKLGVPMWLESGGRRIHASYIEGFGALFNLRVGVPIVEPPHSEAKSEPPKEPSEWEKARSALYGGGQQLFVQQRWAEIAASQAQHYNPRLVEILRKEVIESLRSASNLRHLKPDEWIVVTITGAPNGFETQGGATGVAGAAPAGLPGSAYNSLTGSYSVGGMGSATLRAGRPTMMTFRVKKSTVDAQGAKGTSNEQFAGKVEVTSYLGAESPRAGGGGGAGGNMFGQSAPFGSTTQAK